MSALLWAITAHAQVICSGGPCGTAGTGTVNSGLSGQIAYYAADGTAVSGETAVPVAHGGTNATSAGITAFNNITGYTAAGATGTTSTSLVFSTSPTIVTPTIAKLANLTTNGYVTTASSDGTLGVDTATHRTSAVTTATSTGSPAPAGVTDGIRFFVLTAQAATATFSAPSGTPHEGDLIAMSITDDGTPRTLDFSNSAYAASTDLAKPTITTASKGLELLWKYNVATSKWRLIAKLNNF